MKPRLKQFLSAALIAAVVGALGVTGVSSVMASTLPVEGPNPPAGQCVIDTIHHPAVIEVSHEEYRYSQVIPGQDGTSHTEYRYQTRTVTYGEVEHKYVLGYNFIDGGHVTINGHTVTGHWVSDPGVWHAIPDSVINAVWGAGGIPSNLIGGSAVHPKGSVNLTVYGGPNVSVSYYASTESNPSGYTSYGPFSDWSTTPVTSSDTINVETRVVNDSEAVPAKTVYYLSGGGQSDSLTDANWTTETLDSPWTLVDQRKVIDTAVQNAYTEYKYGDCPPAAPVECSVVGGSYAEDVLATTTAEGDYYEGQSSAVERYYPVTGNLQGLGVQSITFAQVAGYQPSLTFVLNPNGAIPIAKGGDGNVKHYANLVAEWYVNGGSPSTSGTFTVDPATTKFWTNKIANGDPANPNKGSQANPQLLSFFVALWPNNAFTPATGAGAIGGHLGSAKTSETHSLVTAMTGCVNVGFVPEKPDNVVTTKPVTTTSCEANTTTTVTTTTSKPYIWNTDSKSYVLSTDPADWTVMDDSPGVTVALTSGQIAEQCPGNVVVPVGPSYTESCSITAGNTVDAKTDGIKYTDVLTGNTVVTTAVAVAPFVIKDGAQSSWTHTFTGAAAVTCISLPTLSLPPTLAFTGGIFVFWLLVSGLGGVVGGSLLVWASYRRRKQHA